MSFNKMKSHLFYRRLSTANDSLSDQQQSAFAKWFMHDKKDDPI